MIVLIVVAGLCVIFLAWLVGIYNGLVRARNQVKNAWSQIDVQLKRRHDLIPNLVEAVRGYMTHERDTLENVVKARGMAVQAGATGQAGQAIQAENMLTQALGRLFAVAEAYPDLKANQNFLALQEELTSTENKIGFARQFYNDQVMHYNNRIQMFPSNIVAAQFSFTQEPFFEVEDAAQREVPQVKF